MWPYVWAILPTLGVLFLFYYVMKSILEGDRRERLAQAQIEAREDAAARDAAAAAAPPAEGASRPAR